MPSLAVEVQFSEQISLDIQGYRCHELCRLFGENVASIFHDRAPGVSEGRKWPVEIAFLGGVAHELSFLLRVRVDGDPRFRAVIIVPTFRLEDQSGLIFNRLKRFLYDRPTSLRIGILLGRG